MADEQIQELRVRNDQICEELGLPKFQRDEQKRSRGMSNAEYYTADRGESWKFELMRVIDECMRYAGNRDEFLSTKLLHHKDGGVMFYHMVQSFPKGAAIDSRTAHEAAR